jgi:hypothetical protein
MTILTRAFLLSWIASSALTVGLARAESQTSLPIVTNYEFSRVKSLFERSNRLQIPQEMIEVVSIPTPNRAYLEGYPNVFLQNERIVVCNEECEGEQNISPRVSARGDFSISLVSERDSSRRNRKRDESVLRQATVYYWVDHILKRFEELGHQFQHRLVVRVDREVEDPSSGARMENNAFFRRSDHQLTDWSLSFLPAGSGVLNRLLGKDMLPTAFDPSVAMHEATHFLFEEMIGNILNPEIRGLHEAFADYFALSALNADKIGQVALQGDAIRDAREFNLYEPGMEAHDLGNVVLAGLWEIRDLFEDKQLAEQVAFQTIRELSLNPYTSAGDTLVAHQHALQAVVPSLASDEDFQKKVADIWKKTGLAPTERTDYSEVISAPLTREERARFYSLSIRSEIPNDLAVEWGLFPRGTLVLTQGPVRIIPLTEEQKREQLQAIERRKAEGEEPSEPLDHYLEWRFVAVQDLNGESRASGGLATAHAFWVLKDVTNGAIIEVRSTSGQVITPENQASYRRFVEISSSIGNLETFDEGEFGASFIGLLRGESIGGALSARRIERRAARTLSLNFGSQYLPMVEYSIRMRNTFLGWLTGLFTRVGGPMIKEISLFGVAPASLTQAHGDDRLPVLPDGNILVGYELETSTGLKMSVRLVTYGEL